MSSSTIIVPDGEATQQPSVHEENTTQQPEIEKGSGYGAPNEGSGESVTEEDLSPDAEPIPGAGLAQHSDISGE